MNNFNQVINRKSTKSCKFDLPAPNGKNDVFPLWVADMDFKTDSNIINALVDTAKHGAFGYSFADKNYQDAVLSWLKRHYNLKVKRKDLIQTPGVVFAIAHAIKAFSKPGDKIIIQEPVYYPFKNEILSNNRKVLNNNLIEKDGYYKIDFKDLEKKAKKAKLLILSNPHNPVGRVFTKKELKKIADICLKNNVLIIADEIHADFISPTKKHTCIMTLGKKVRNNTILCTAPSKSFNLAGLQVSNIVICNKKLRKKFQKELRKSGAGSLSIMAYNACEAAYTYGDEYIKELNQMINENFNLILKTLEKMPKIKALKPEGTYLIWLDCRELGLNDKELDDFFLDEAKLWLDSGYIFGKSGKGFMRLNAALPQSELKKVLNQLEESYKKHWS